MDLEQTPFGQDSSFADNPETRCPSVLLLDTSHSMDGEPLKELQKGLQKYQEDLLADDLAKKRVEIAIVTFGPVRTIQPFSTPDLLDVPDLSSTTGMTPMGGAILEGIKLVHDRKQDFKAHGIGYYRPWIFLITDGAPNDGENIWQDAINQLRNGLEERRFLFYAVGVRNADIRTLSELPTSTNTPLKLDGLRFSNLFKWLSQSQRAASRSQPGDRLLLPEPDWTITT